MIFVICENVFCSWVRPVHASEMRSVGFSVSYLHISKRPNKGSSNKKALRKKCPSMFPKSGAPMEADAHFQALLDITFGVPIKRVLPQWSLHGISCKAMPHAFSPPAFIFQRAPPPNSRFPPAGKGPPWKEMPISGAHLNIL